MAATLKLTEPLPAPAAPDVIVIHGTLLVAIQAQPAPAVTDDVPGPPAEPIDCDVGDMEKVQPNALCETVKV